MVEQYMAVRRVSHDSSTTGVELDSALQFDRTKLHEAESTRAQVIHKIFEDVVASHAGRIAISYLGREITYRELETLANSVARRLWDLSVRPGDIVAVILPHSIEIVVAFLAILKCGAAYLPLDDSNPSRRNEEFMRAAYVKVIVGSERINGAHLQNRAVLLASEFATATGTVESVDTCSDDKAYVMYTSGSTGVPKGVVIPHRGVVRLVRNANYISIDKNDRILQLAPPSFDASTFEIWGALLNGATLVPYSGQTMDPNRLKNDIRVNGITILWLTAGLFSLVADQAIDALHSLRVLLAGGDVLNARYVNNVLDYVQGITVINGYGPTENTTFTCCHAMTLANKPNVSVPIGKPITGTNVHILDDTRRPVPVNTVGELYTSGQGVALGYLHEQHGDAFFFDESIAPGLIYKTGDLVQELQSGELVFIGRRDTLVKVRGYRVSLEEVRTHLVSLEEVVDAVVLKQDVSSGDQILVAYVQTKASREIDVKTIRRRLAQRIPGYMIPSRWVFDHKLTINDNGKIDRIKIVQHLHSGE